MDNVRIIKVESIEIGMLDAVNRLLGQLTSNPVYLSEETLKEIILSPSSELYLLYYGNEIAGMFTLGTYSTPTGIKVWLEDLVVDSIYRGMSLGKEMVNEVIKIVSCHHGVTLMLTSKPARIAANNLYRSSGFVQKQTNVYKMEL